MLTKEKIQEYIHAADDLNKRRLFVQKFLFHGTPFVFDKRDSDYFDFRRRIADKFEVGFHEVFIVGSAKLGFSYHKENNFNYNSDIDVVIVNENLFEIYYKKIAEYQYSSDKQRTSMEENRMYDSFVRYLVKGWMRPDKLPTSFQVELLKNDWFDYFRSLSFGKSEVGNYDVKAGLFKNRDYLEMYYTKGVEDVFNKLRIAS